MSSERLTIDEQKQYIREYWDIINAYLSARMLPKPKFDVTRQCDFYTPEIISALIVLKRAELSALSGWRSTAFRTTLPIPTSDIGDKQQTHTLQYVISLPPLLDVGESKTIEWSALTPAQRKFFIRMFKLMHERTKFERAKNVIALCNSTNQIATLMPGLLGEKPSARKTYPREFDPDPSALHYLSKVNQRLVMTKMSVKDIDVAAKKYTDWNKFKHKSLEV